MTYTLKTENNTLEIMPDAEDGTPGQVYVGISFREQFNHTEVSESVSLNPDEAYKAILAIASAAGLNVATTPSGTHIQTPISPAITGRKNELALQFFYTEWTALGSTGKNVIDFIVQGEIDRGELS